MQALIQTPLGPISVLWRGEALIGVDLEPSLGLLAEVEPPAVVRARLDRYFADGRVGIELPLNLAGTAFQRRVWAALQRIPAGETTTYGALAEELGTGARAIGQACRNNPCPIVVPCHRVVARQGLGGFAGDRSGRRLAVKRWLLRHEGAVLQR